MNRTRLAGAAALGSVLSVLGACAAAPGGDDAPKATPAALATTVAPELVGTHWHLVAAESGALASLAARSGVTLEFGADRVLGNGGCNRYSADYSVAGNTLTVGPVSATKRGCPGAAGTVESTWHAALAAPLSITTSPGQLQLRSADGVVLTFAPGEPAAAR